MRHVAAILAALCVLAAPVAAQQPAQAPPPAAEANPMLAGGSMPDVQAVVGPGVDGWQVALVYPKRTDKAAVEADVAAVTRAMGKPAKGLKIETRRLEREDTREVGPAPTMTSATFETDAELVDYGAGRLAVEPFLIGLQARDRIAVVFLVPGKFSYTAARKVADNRVALDVVGGEGAYTFLANIRSRPLDGFVVPAADTPTPQAAPAGRRRSPLAGIAIAAAMAVLAGGAAFFATRRFARG